MFKTKSVLVITIISGIFFSSLHATELSTVAKTKLEAKIASLKTLGSDPEIVKTVKEYNVNPPAAYKDMTNDKWKILTIMSPEIRAFSKNKIAVYVKTKIDESVSELFISAANGCKVAFLSKPTSWCHKGKPKHDLPMAGKIWIGEVEVDESTGVQAIQVSVPILDDTKPIGSIVLGFNVTNL
jgi:hypothetical protein